MKQVVKSAKTPDMSVTITVEMSDGYHLDEKMEKRIKREIHVLGCWIVEKMKRDDDGWR